jgi:uncharacterized protein YndB with AHSA1/START domain
MPKPSLTLTRHLKAPVELVYNAWTDPAQMMKWYAPEDMATPEAEADPRVGGHFRVRMRSTEGEEVETSGTYQEVVPNEKLVFTWGWKSTPEIRSLVTVLLKADGGGTLLTLIHEQFIDEEARDNHDYGWTGALNKLEKLVAENG